MNKKSGIVRCRRCGFKPLKPIMAILAAAIVWLIITRKLDIKGTSVSIQDSVYFSSGMPILEEWRNSIVTREDLNLYNDLGTGYHKIKTNKCLFINQSKTGLEKVMNDPNFMGVHCGMKNASFSDTSDHHTALASIPGSGNTWTRHLIEYISGIHTGSIYNAGILKPVFIGEGYTSRVIAIKTHKNDYSNYDNAVLLIRNPREAILAWYNYRNTKSITNKADETLFDTSGWYRFVAKRTDMWKKFYLGWLNGYKGRMMVLSYSRLRQDLFNEVYRLGDFLNISMSYKSLWCVFEKKEGSYHRQSHIDANKVFNKTMLDKIARARDEVEEVVRRLYGKDARELF